MIEKIYKAIQIYHWLTIRELGCGFSILFGSVLTILTGHLGMRRVAVKFVSKLLTDELDLLECAESDAKCGSVAMIWRQSCLLYTSLLSANQHR